MNRTGLLSVAGWASLAANGQDGPFAVTRLELYELGGRLHNAAGHKHNQKIGWRANSMGGLWSISSEFG
jgi:hypothetical protein